MPCARASDRHGCTFSTHRGTCRRRSAMPARSSIEGHIPGARFFDLDVVSDPSSPLPHTLPAPEHFADEVARLGVSSGDQVVVYDGSGTNLSAPRAWWMFRAFGHDAVSVLDGGMAAWIASGGTREQGASPVTPRGSFVATPRSVLVRNGQQVRAWRDSGGQVVDMRSRGRFEGTEARATCRPAQRPHSGKQEHPARDARR